MNKIVVWIKKHPIFIGCIALIAVLECLNFTGFCYTKGAYLSEKELLDNFLFKVNAKVFTEEQKKNEAKKRGLEYPECCRVRKEPSSLESVDKFLNKIFGRYLHEIEVNGYDQSSKNVKVNYYSVSSCGFKSVDYYGTDISRDQYESALTKNSEYWKAGVK